jgi:hypothetical protein
MNKETYIMLAPIKLLQGVEEKFLISASDKFEKDFVKKQSGIIQRILLKDKEGNYADLVFFESKVAANKVLEAEASSEDCMEFFKIMEMPDENVPDMGVRSFEVLKSYGS